MKRLIQQAGLCLATLFLAPAIQAGETTNKLGITMVDIPAGSFCVQPTTASDCIRVSVKAFRMGKTEVTTDQFAKFVAAAKPYHLLSHEFINYNTGSSNSDPIVWVDLQAVQDFIKWLNGTDGGGYRLPSEAEWEYACRAGGVHKYCGGDDLNSVGWHLQNSGDRQRPVGGKRANAFGLYDMSGNVSEFVEHCRHENYNGILTNGNAWAKECVDKSMIMIRGGNWTSYPSQVAKVQEVSRAYRSNTLGFRLAWTPVSKAEAEKQRLEWDAEVRHKTEAERLATEAPRLAQAETERLAKEGFVFGQTLKDCPDCPDMVIIPSGSFIMGSNRDGENPMRRVDIKSFALARTEVTQEQWRAVMGDNPSHFAQCGDNCPVEKVTWKLAQEFVRKLSQKTGKQYRLPSEAEWEYACLAGGRHEYCGSDNPDSVAWFKPNSRDTTHPVALKQANAFGLFDMSGNVWEWLEDCWHENYNGAPSDGSAWTTGSDCGSRAIRGSSFHERSKDGRAAKRSAFVSPEGFYFNGLRPARVLP